MVTDNRLSDTAYASPRINSGSVVDIIHMTFRTLTIRSDKKYYENGSDYAVLVKYWNVSLKQNSEHVNGGREERSYADKVNTPASRDKKKDPKHRVNASVIPLIPPKDLRLLLSIFDRLPGKGNA